jgi:ABC-type Zn uptake system ZnuABC Zn-binding protein ZnuA
MPISGLRWLVAISLLSSFALLGSCAKDGGQSPASASRGQSPEVMAAESFLADIAQNVAGDKIRIGTLVQPDTDPHEFQPRPGDIARIRATKALLVNGRGYEAWLAPSMAALEGTRIIEASGGVAATPGAAASDPHLWMDPRNVLAYVETIRSALSGLYPAYAGDFSRNAAAYSKELAALDGRIRAVLSRLPEGRRVLLTNHDALGHFAAAYGFKVIGTVLEGTSSESAPSAKALSRLIDTIRSSGAGAIFLDVGENAAIAREVAKEGGVKVVTDLYVEGVSGPKGPAPTYIAMLDHDAEAVYDALR